MTLRPSLFRLAGALVAAGICMPASAQDSGDGYRLGAMDKLRIRVVEWQSAEGAVRDWSALGGDYLVGPDGSISLPFIGQIEAAGRTPAEIASVIGEDLQQTLGLMDRPNASVELAEFRPVFVAGDAQNPGRYPYDPDLTVLKAVSIAGGLRRATDSNMRLERDVIRATGEHDVVEANRNRLIVKRARLEAEAANRTEFDAPAELKGLPDFASMISDETSIMETRRKRLDLQLEALDDLKQLLANEVEALQKKIVAQNRQIELTRKELSGIGDLSNQGLVVNSRLLAVERTMAELETRLLDYETALLQARQEITKAQQSATDLENDRAAEIARERQQVEADIRAADLQLATNQNLVSEAMAQAPVANVGLFNENVRIEYKIVRTVEGEARELTAEENTPVLPGDVVKVALAAIPVN
ncbi:polysaccharide biosynthesis/export family protein [Aureimonas altamirensis]|uniref:polysaccharide biosynthesis/export family protein n=1 Tax=Aureimonas altamirensis TaxID=370622 RepID=UPI001E53E1B2|nr:polysaccharide biosynthesis/export family protein [Aureimonas altamirensis]UHD45562.1 polysaccharide biosynthesis/export family protein [Aureimonas altamirensis]